MTEHPKCQAGFDIVDGYCGECGASDHDMCGKLDGETYRHGLEIVRLRKALSDIAGGSFPGASNYVVAGDWRGAFGALQKIAAATLARNP